MSKLNVIEVEEKDGNVSWLNLGETEYEIFKIGEWQGVLRTIKEFKEMALSVGYGYDHGNLTDEQAQELTDYISFQVSKVIDFIGEKIKEEENEI